MQDFSLVQRRFFSFLDLRINVACPLPWGAWSVCEDWTGLAQCIVYSVPTWGRTSPQVYKLNTKALAHYID